MTRQNKQIIIFAIAFYAYCGLWLYVLYPLLDNLWKRV
jgi:hypothetical protein